MKQTFFIRPLRTGGRGYPRRVFWHERPAEKRKTRTDLQQGNGVLPEGEVAARLDALRRSPVLLHRHPDRGQHLVLQRPLQIQEPRLRHGIDPAGRFPAQIRPQRLHRGRRRHVRALLLLPLAGTLARPDDDRPGADRHQRIHITLSGRATGSRISRRSTRSSPNGCTTKPTSTPIPIIRSAATNRRSWR